MFQSVSIISLYNPLFQCFETPEMGPGISTFSRADFNFVSKRFETTETFGLKSIFFMFQSVSIISLYCFSVSKHQKWGLVFSPFPEFVSILFRNVSKQLQCPYLVNFLHVSIPFNNFPILFHCFKTPEMGPGIFTFSRACFNFVSKRFDSTETFGLCQFSSCFSPFQ